MTTLAENKIITPNFHQTLVQGNVKIFYRSAGKASAPVILLLHGFPTSSNMFRNLIPLLASKFHVIAPDLPGFGFTEIPDNYEFTFANLAESIDQFLKVLEISKFSVYVFDYGAPVGFRLALKNPSNVTGIVVQNGNAYEVGLDDRFWSPIKEYWMRDQNDPQSIKTFTEYLDDQNNVSSQYLNGVKDPSSVDPTNYTLDISLLSRRRQAFIQTKLFHDYKTNVELYPKFQLFFRESSVPILVTWGKNDSIFTIEGAESYRSDATDIKIVYYESGHFALETHVAEIAYEITTEFYEKIAS